jgi:hypothetical protein
VSRDDAVLVVPENRGETGVVTAIFDAGTSNDKNYYSA